MSRIISEIIIYIVIKTEKILTNETGMISVSFVKGSFNIQTHFVKNLKI